MRKWQTQSYIPQTRAKRSAVSVHELGGVTMHSLTALWEWYIIVHWTPLIKNQDGNTRYHGSHPPWFQDGCHEKRQNAYIVTVLYQPPTICYAYFYERTIYM